MPSCTAMLVRTLTRLQAAMCENLSYGSRLLLIAHECSQPIEPAGSWGWRPRRTGSGIRGRRDQPPLIEAPECTTAYQGGYVGGAAGFEVYVPQLRRLIVTRRQHTGAIGAKLGRDHAAGMAFQGSQQE